MEPSVVERADAGANSADAQRNEGSPAEQRARRSVTIAMRLIGPPDAGSVNNTE